jgi:hypothetical protein
MPEKKDVFITKTVIIATAAIGVSLCLITLLIQYLVFPNIAFENSEKIKVAITPVSATSPFQRQPEGQGGLLGVTETPSMVGVIALGMNIKVSGTGNEGLRMRSGAGIDQQTMYVAQEGESFQIIDGPKILDSLIWWKIQASNDPGKTGWSVQDYMTPY